MAKFSEWVGKIFSLTDHQPLISIFGNETYTGKSVTPQTALGVSTAWACIKLLTETLATMPVNMIEKLPNDFRQKNNSHELAWVLKIRPNKLMTPVEFFECMQLNLLTSGNAYAEIEMNGVGDVIGLWPLLSQNMKVEQLDDGSVSYQFHTPKGVLIYKPEQILHIKLFGWSGLVGLSPIAYAAQSLGLEMATLEFGSRWFGSGARPSGFIMFDQVLTKPQRAQYKKNFETLHEGLARSHKLALLEAGMKYEAVTIPPNESQFLETRAFQVPEICRFYLVQPHKVQHLDNATYSNIEHQNLEFLQTTFRPYAIRWEQGMENALLKPQEKGSWQIRFNLNALLRADTEARGNFYSQMVQNGLFSRNEVRSLEDVNPSDQAGADDLTVQSNMIDLDQLQKVGKPND